MDSAQLPAPQIGRILVAAGLLSEPQLAEALDEQRRTGGRLGEIIVRRGFISGPALANALAEQHGGLLKTEYGFATGLGGQAAQKAATEAAAEAATAAPMPLLRTADPAPVSPLRTAEPVPPAPPEAPAPLEVAAAPEPEPAPAPTPIVVVPVPIEPEHQEAPAEPQPQFAFAPVAAPAPEPGAEPKPQFAFAPTPEPEPEPEPEPAPQPQFEAAHETVAPVPDERDALIESLRARVDAQDRELARLRAELDEVRAARELAAPTAETSMEIAPASAPAAPHERYLVCVPTPAGYVLLDRIGPIPTVGQSVDVPEEDASFTVTKVVRLPRNGRPCAYLQRL